MEPPVSKTRQIIMTEVPDRTESPQIASRRYPSGLVPGAAQHFPGQCPGHLALINHRNAVHQHVSHALRELIWIVERGQIENGRRVEDDDVSAHSRTQQAPAFQPKALRGERRELANSILERQFVLFAHVLAQNPRKRSIRSRMRM